MSAEIKRSWFYKDGLTEGFLGNPDDCRILFILREPNSDGREAGIFWFKEVYLGNRRGKVYLEPLRRTSSLLLPSASDPLFHAAYINLHPDKGSNTIGPEYKNILTAFAQGENRENRWSIILGMPDHGVIVTTTDIHNAMKAAIESGKVNSTIQCKSTIRLKFADHCLPSFTFSHRRKSIQVISMYHPSYLRRRHWDPEQITICDP